MLSFVSLQNKCRFIFYSKLDKYDHLYFSWAINKARKRWSHLYEKLFIFPNDLKRGTYFTPTIKETPMISLLLDIGFDNLNFYIKIIEH